jgi:hypothetical protein
VKTVPLPAGTSKRVVLACGAGERLIAAYDARGFFTFGPPTQQQAKTVVTRRSISGARVVVSAHSGASGAVVQLSTVCAGGK